MASALQELKMAAEGRQCPPGVELTPGPEEEQGQPKSLGLAFCNNVFQKLNPNFRAVAPPPRSGLDENHCTKNCGCW